MFYPVDSLKRGGRFYLCWVADSWPLRFATITHRQLWSQDIRKICDDLLEVMMNESGRPANRFSLRLSSQLMRGLVRLYQRKVTVFLGDLCMINANVTKHVNKKWNINETEVVAVTHRPLPQLAAPQQLVMQEEPENEQRIEEIIQNSGNVVGNIQDITLKESTIPQVQLPANDGFGEENPEQALLMVANQTLEMMLVADASAAQHSGLEHALDTTGDRSGDKSADKSRALHDVPAMERIEELDVTLFRKSFTAEDRLTMGGLEKDVPEIPEILLPEIPGQTPKLQIAVQPQPIIEAVPIPEPEKQQQPEELHDKEKEVVEIELEELEEAEPAAKRRRPKKLIVDRKIKLSADYLVTRIENPQVELRCEDSSEDIISIRVPAETLLRRCAHAGPHCRGAVGLPLARLFRRNLGVSRHARPYREMEEAIAERLRRPRTRSVLERIEEEREPVLDRPLAQVDQPVPELETRESLYMTEAQNVTLPQELNVADPPNVTITHPEDIGDLPTQKIEVLSQTRKRTSDYEISPKRQRLSGYVSFRQSQQMAMEVVPDIEAEKENIPSAANVQRVTRSHAASPEKSLTVMLQEVGLADLPPQRPEEQESTLVEREVDARPRKGSESSETQLGSLDRTKVSLGDSDLTTDSRRFIREQWGTEGTMVKILGALKAGVRPLHVRALVARGPALPGAPARRALVAARCFTSILKLKQHGFIIIIKDQETLEIRDILLGPKFDQVQ